jgi:hypothetical protein
MTGPLWSVNGADPFGEQVAVAATACGRSSAKFRRLSSSVTRVIRSPGPDTSRAR